MSRSSIVLSCFAKLYQMQRQPWKPLLFYHKPGTERAVRRTPRLLYTSSALPKDRQPCLAWLTDCNTTGLRQFSLLDAMDALTCEPDPILHSRVSPDLRVMGYAHHKEQLKRRSTYAHRGASYSLRQGMVIEAAAASEMIRFTARHSRLADLHNKLLLNSRS